MAKSASLKKIIILVTILALPGFLYYLLQEKGENRYRPLPIFGSKKVAGTFHTRFGKKIPDTIYHTVRNFSLTNQAGKKVNYPVDTSSIVVANFFFTRCPGFCDNMTKEMARIVDVYQKNRLIKFFSISVDPNDNPQSLQKFAEKYNVLSGKWDLLSGTQDEIYQLAKEEFLVDAIADTTTSNHYIHSPLLILLDPQRRIRGFYDSGNKEQVDKLIDEVKVLITEELRKVKNR